MLACKSFGVLMGSSKMRFLARSKRSWGIGVARWLVWMTSIWQSMGLGVNCIQYCTTTIIVDSHKTWLIRHIECIRRYGRGFSTEIRFGCTDFQMIFFSNRLAFLGVPD